MPSIGTDIATRSTSLSKQSDAFSSMKSEDFIRVMFTELTNQDPLSPNESKDLLAQISTIRQIESDLAMSERLTEMVRQNEITASSSLIGKFVLGQSESLADVAGYVDSVSVTRDGVVLNLSGGFKVPMNRLVEVVDPDLVGGSPDNQAPRVVKGIPEQNAVPGQEFRFRFDIGTFSDDGGVESLSYSATLSDGNPLPGWLKFDPINREFHGTPPAGTTGSISIRVTAIDAHNARVSTGFTIKFVESSGEEEETE